LNQRPRFVDLSGYIVSGKTAYSDLLREIKGFQVPDPEFEFELIRIQGGIRDLETALVDDWSPMRADSAIRRFRRLVKRMGTNHKRYDPRTWFEAAGWSLDDHFGGRFTSLSNQFAKQLIATSWRTNWPYPLVELSSCELFHSHIYRKLGKIFGKSLTTDFDISLAYPENFLAIVNEFLAELLGGGVSDNITTIVTHNAFEPFNPSRALRYLKNSKCIIVDRDPRDSYVAMLPHKHLALPVNDFILRFITYRKASEYHIDTPDKILRLRYEDLLFNYKDTVRRILNFLEVSATEHIEQFKHFNPMLSIKYAGIWKKHNNQADIRLIKIALSPWCDSRVD
jgi:hypothetical protein